MFRFHNIYKLRKPVISGILYPKKQVSGKRLFHGDETETPEKTMKQVMDYIIEKTNLSKSKAQNFSLQEFSELIPKSQEELPPRRMMDSYDSALIPLGADEDLRQKYVTFHGGLRVGRLLEDLDIIGSWIAYKHMLNPLQIDDLPIPFFIVTATVDRIDFVEGMPLRGDQDIKLGGFVSWTGKSSMEVTLHVHQLKEYGWEKVTKAVFLFVCREPITNGPSFVNPLECKTQEEKEIFTKGQMQKFVRKKFKQESLFNAPPTDEEKTLVHELFMKMAAADQHSYSPRYRPEDSVCMADTKLKNLIICHPEFRNIFHKMFGGFLMRQAMELAYANAAVYAKQQPEIVHIDDILFRIPVEIGSLLYLNSQVVFTEDKYMQISTRASVMDIETQTSDLTNILHFTFGLKSPVPTCLPHTYHEAMRYIDGRRRYQLVRGVRKFYEPI